MASAKRRRNQTANAPVSTPAQPQRASDPEIQGSSAGMATLHMADLPEQAGTPAARRSADATAGSLAAERLALRNRNAGLFGGIGLLLIVATALLLYFRPFGPAPATPTAPAVPLPTTAPAVQAPTTAPAVVAPTVAPAVQAPTAVPAVQAPPAAPQAGDQSGAITLTCNAVAGVPVFANAVCIDQDTDTDDGVVKQENTYTVPAATDEIRRFYEGAFGQGGWTLQEFTYDINLGARQLTIDIEGEQGVSGPVSRIRLREQGASAAGTTCGAIAGLAAFPGATCVDYEADQDDGIIETEHTYTAAATPEDIRRFYADALAQNGWGAQEFSYQLGQGTRRVQINAEAQLGATATELKIAEE